VFPLVDDDAREDSDPKISFLSLYLFASLLALSSSLANPSCEAVWQMSTAKSLTAGERDKILKISDESDGDKPFMW
jgi:hypothetical protein